MSSTSLPSVCIVRHGETAWTVTGQHTGRTDIPRELFEDGCPNGESAADVGARADRVIDRLCLRAGNVLLFGHRDMLRVMAARRLQFPALEGRRFYLDVGSLSLLGYDLATSEPVIRLWNEGVSPQSRA